MAIDGELIKQARESRNKSQAYLADLDELLSIAQDLQYDPYVFVGKTTFENGDLLKHPRLDELSEMRKAISGLTSAISPTVPDEYQRMCERVMVNAPLRDLVDTVQFWEGGMLKRFTDMAHGYLAGAQNEGRQKGEQEATA